MKKQIFTTCCLAVALFGSAAAQEKGTSPFVPGWFIGANGGINFFMAEGNNFFQSTYAHSGPHRNLGYLGRASLGYSFTPEFSLRAMLGYNDYKWKRGEGLRANAIFPTSRFSTENLTLDALVNLSNLWGGYKFRKVDFSAFAGVGAAYLNDNSRTYSLAGLVRAGLQTDYHLSDAVSLNLMVDGNLASDNFNDVVEGLPVDVFGEVTVGVTYQLPSKAKEEAKAKAAAKAKADAEAKLQPKSQPKEEQVTPPVDEKPQVAETKPAEVTPAAKEESAPVETITTLNEHLFYSLNKRDVSTDAQVNSLKKVSEFVKQHPDAKIIISGYTDKETGTIDVNNQISKERAVNVANKLIREYGIPYKNIWVRWYGGGIQPYLKVEKNRLVIVRSSDSKVTIPLQSTKGVEKKK